jgi:hypothetical protein
VTFIFHDERRAQRDQVLNHIDVAVLRGQRDWPHTVLRRMIRVTAERSEESHDPEPAAQQAGVLSHASGSAVSAPNAEGSFIASSRPLSAAISSGVDELPIR